jgi:hypothetical protein
MAESIDRGRFITLLTERFPKVAASIDDCSQGLLHLEMATLARATQAAIDEQDKATVRAHFEFVDEVFRDATPEVENAVNVSYLEHLRFEGRKAAPTRARELLTPRLQQALAELEEYLNRLFARPKNNIKENTKPVARRQRGQPRSKPPKSPRRKR